MITNTETRPFFVQQAKSGRWNVWVFQRETEDGYKYAVKQTFKDPDVAHDWGLNYINHVIRYWFVYSNSPTLTNTHEHH